MTIVNLRRATPDDIDNLVTFEKSVDGVKTYSAMTDKEEFLAEFKYNNVFVIENNGRAVGSVMYEIKGPDHAYIGGLVIDTRFQGMGLAREAMTKLLKELEHYKRIDLVTHPENEKAIKLYKFLGFNIESRKENYFGDGEPRIVMAKVLN